MLTDQGIDYKVCHFSRILWVRHLVIGMAYYFLMGMIFYQNIWLSSVATLGVILYVKEQRQRQIDHRKAALLLAFKEGIYALASSLSAGRSVEQAFVQSLGDLKLVYGDNEDIIKEWQRIVYRLNMNEPLESALTDMAERADMEDIYNFTGVFIMAKRSGGDLLHIIKDTNRLINEKSAIQKEIDVLVTQKKFEQKILSYIIPGMILFFAIASPDFLQPLYEGLEGRLIMTLALGLYVISARIGKEIVEIEV